MERRRESVVTAEEQDPNRSAAFLVFIEMEKVLDKLKLLNYDKEFVQDLKMKPINRHYFASQTNPGEQFYAFTSLSAWLIRKSGKRFEQPQEFDDPNATISKILDNLRSNGVPIEFPPSKLKQGFGEHAVFILDQLADQALKQTRFLCKRPEPPEEQPVEEEVAEDESELLLERVEEEMAAEFTVSDEEPDDMLLRVDDLAASKFDVESQLHENILESSTDLESWKLELERVLPQLKVTIKTEVRDWRSHLEAMQQHKQEVSAVLGGARSELESLHIDISRSLDKISAREKFLNTQLEPMLAEYRKLQGELSRTKEQYRAVSGGVQERTRSLALISDELESLKQEMEERGASMTDGTPLVALKKTLMRLRSEVTAMDVRIGVLDHGLMQSRLREKALLQQEIGAEQ